MLGHATMTNLISDTDEVVGLCEQSLSHFILPQILLCIFDPENNGIIGRCRILHNHTLKNRFNGYHLNQPAALIVVQKTLPGHSGLNLHEIESRKAQLNDVDSKCMDVKYV